MIDSYRRSMLAALACAAIKSGFAAEQDVGIVLMHGKWDRHPTNVFWLGRELEAAGFKVATPTMPWAAVREYDVPYGQALVEIELAAKNLRDKGAQRIVVGGHSFGANGALAYAASGRPVDAIFALAPGHVPDRASFRKALEPSVAKARAMLDSGAGKERSWFDDLNQGQKKQIRLSAETYFSYFDPEGLGAMSKTSAAIPSAMPLFMAVGTGEPIASVAEDFIFNRAPKHEKSVYTLVPTDHNGVTAAATAQLLTWLRSLGY